MLRSDWLTLIGMRIYPYYWWSTKCHPLLIIKTTNNINYTSLFNSTIFFYTIVIKFMDFQVKMAIHSLTGKLKTSKFH